MTLRLYPRQNRSSLVCEELPTRKIQGRHAWTTPELTRVLEEYLDAVQKCKRDQLKLIRKVSSQLLTQFSTSIKLFLHGEVIGKCIHRHLSQVICKGWRPAIVGKAGTVEVDIQGAFLSLAVQYVRNLKRYPPDSRTDGSLDLA